MHEKYFGYVCAIGAYTLWGIFPLYWKLMQDVGSMEVICHRVLFSLLTLVVCISFVHQWQSISVVMKDRNRLLLCTVAAILISTNWLVFIWAVQNDYVIEASLGYFINPLLTVLLAVVLFRERISRIQWASIALAIVGVIVMTVETGRFPWIAFLLSTSFASYAAVKKKTTLPAIAGLGMETAILAPIAIGLLVYFLGIQHTANERSMTTWSLLVLGGPITTLPLVLFASAAKSVSLVAVGMLQYVGPTLQFLLGWYWFQEEISTIRFIGFGFVWFALVLFTWGTILLEREKRVPKTAKETL